MRAVVLADFDNDGFPDVVAASSDGISTRTATTAAESSRRGPSSLHLLRNLLLRSLSNLTNVEALLAVDVDKDGDLDLLVSAGGKTRVLVNDGGNANGWLDVVLEGLQTGSGKVNKQGVGSLVEVKAGNLVRRAHGGAPAHALRPRRAHEGRRRAGHVDERRAAEPLRPEIEVRREGSPAAQGLVPVRVRAKRRDRRLELRLGRARPRRRSGSSTTASTSRAPTRASGCFIDGDTLQPDADRPSCSSTTPRSCGRSRTSTRRRSWPSIIPRARASSRTSGRFPGVMEKKLFTVARPRPLRAAFSDASGRSEDVTSRLARRDQVYVEPGARDVLSGREAGALSRPRPRRREGGRSRRPLPRPAGSSTRTRRSTSRSRSGRTSRISRRSSRCPDGTGGWKVAMESFGFPAGKTKTMPVDLTGLVDPDGPARAHPDDDGDLLGRGLRHGERSGRRRRHDSRSRRPRPSSPSAASRAGIARRPTAPRCSTTATSRPRRAGRTCPGASRASAT